MKHFAVALGILLSLSIGLLLLFWTSSPFLLSAAPRQEQSVTLAVSADVGLSSYQRRESTSNGLGVTTAIRQNQNWSGFESRSLLMAFDAAPIKGWTVSRAYLHLYLAKGDLHGVGLTEVLAPWTEPRTVNFTTEVGGPSWLFARTPRDPAHPAASDWWAWPGSGFCSVAWAHPSARYQFIGPTQIERARVGSPATQTSAARGDRFLHLKLPVDPDLVASLGAGTCYGLVLTDDKGQVAEAYSLLGPGTPYQDNDAEDIYVFTRNVQDPTLRPRLEVFGEKKGFAAPPVPEGLKIARVDAGSGTLWLEFAAPSAAGGGNLLAYDVSSRPAGSREWTPFPRWASARPAAAGSRQIVPVWTLPPGAHELAIRSVDKAGYRGEPAIVSVSVPPPPAPKLASPVPATPSSLGPGRPASAGDFILTAVPDLAKVDPVSGRVLRHGNAYREDAKYLQGAGNPVFDGQGVALTAAANEVAAFQLIVTRKTEKLAGLKVEVSDLTGPQGRTVASHPNAQWFRVWYVKSQGNLKEITDPEAGEDRTVRPVAWHGDACLPLAPPFEETFDLPAADNGVPGQTNQAVWVDLFMPKTTPAGTYHGVVKVTAGGKTATLPLAVKLLPLTLPDEPTWRVDLNSYGGLAAMAGVDEKDPRAVEAEYSFYRMAKAHRQMINALPYSQRGTVDALRTPLIAGEGAVVAVTDWSPWDARLGPLLDGSAFTPEKGYVGPGAGTPISQIYLPFHENWPLPIATYFGDYAPTGDRIEFAEWAKKSRPLEEAYGQEFKDGFAAVAGQFARHFKEKGWTRTEFQFLMNNKYYYRAQFFGDHELGTSFWLLDEPVDHDDYAADAFFLSLARRGVDSARAPEVRFAYRADVSMPEMSRGLLSGACDFWMLGWDSIPSGYVATARVRQRFFPGERYWQYGGAVSTSGAPVGLVGSFLAGWCGGSDGILPYWSTMGGRDWSRADDLAIFYTGKNYARGSRTYPGVLPGLRMKVMRRAQQDVEYLQLLSQAEGWTREAVRQALAAYADDPAAPSFMFSKLTPERADALRASVVQTLLGTKRP